MAQSVARERVANARIKMLIQFPFFAVLMMGLEIEFTDTLPDGRPMPTMATDMKHIWINPAFVDSVNDDVLMFGVAHEIDHVAKRHPLRAAGRPHRLWNIACDYSNNLFLKDCGFTIWDKALLDERFRDTDGFAMSADKIFSILRKEQEDAAKNRKPGDPEPGFGDPGGEHDSPMLDDLQEPAEAMDPVEQARMERDIERRVAQAATTAKMIGDMPAALERFVNQILKPQVPWYDKLRHLMAQLKNGDDDWSRRNRRFRNIYLPSDLIETMGGIGIINDTSGSIGSDELIKFNSEANSVIEDLHPEWLRLLWADSQVAGEQLFEPGDTFTPKPKGGGGTDMRVPLAKVADYEPEVVLLFTDGWTPWPDHEPDYPLIVCCTTDAAVPIGEVIRIV